MKRLLIIVVTLLILLATSLWAFHVLASHNAPIPATATPVSYGIPQEIPAAPAPTDPTAVNDATPPTTADPALIEQPTPYPLLDFSATHAGGDTEAFTPPTGIGYIWQVNVSFTPQAGQGTQALLFVMNADTDCSQTPPNLFGCGVINLVDVDSHGQPITFTFPEQGMDNKVYLKMATGDWHITVTAYDKPLYPVIRAETLSDFYGAIN